MKTWTATQRAVLRASVSVVAGVGMLIQPLAGVVTPPVSTAQAQTVPPRKGDTQAPAPRTATVSGASTITAASATASELAAAMDINTGSCTANSSTACLVSADLGTPVQSDPIGTAVFPASPTVFPAAGGSFAAISSGNASIAFNANTSGSTSTPQSATALKTAQGQDMVQLTLTVKVPTDTSGRRATYWAVDWKFLTEEFQEWVGSRFNDTFLIEVGQSNFIFNGNVVNAPNNVATDPKGTLISVNTSGTLPAVMNAAYANGTTYDGATLKLTTVAPVPSAPASQITLIFSVMDLGDSIYDTTVFLDNFQFLFDPLPTASQIPAWADVPVLWCVLTDNNGQEAGAVRDSLIAPGTGKLDTISGPGLSSGIYNNNAVTELNPDGSNTTVTSAQTRVYFKPANPATMTYIPDVLDDHLGSGTQPGYVVLPTLDNGQDRDHVFSDCRNRWNTASPNVANTGIVAVLVQGFVNLQGGVLSGFQGEGTIPARLNPVDQSSVGILVVAGSSDKVLAHEFAHALSLYHGDGFDNHDPGKNDQTIDGPEPPAAPGGPPQEENDAPSGLQPGMNNLMQLQNTLITDGQGGRVRCQTLVVPNVEIHTGTSGSVCDFGPGALQVGAAALANPVYRANVSGGTPTSGIPSTAPDYAQVRSLGIVTSPPSEVTKTSLFANVGLLPANTTGVSVFLLLDADQKSGTGGDPHAIDPAATNPSWPSGSGIELAARADLSYNQTTGQWTATALVYQFAGGSWSPVTGASAQVTAQTTSVHDLGQSTITLQNTAHTVVVSVPESTVAFDRTTWLSSLRAVTQTPQGGDDKLALLPLTPAKLPSCQVTPSVLPPGGTGSVQAFDLPANSAVGDVKATLVGPDGGVVGSGTTDANGAVTISIALPKAAASGQRFISVGVPNSPVVATCDVVVDRPPAADGASPAPGTVKSVVPGNPLSFPVQFSDPDAGGAVAVHSVNLPSGASLTCPTIAKTTACTVSWTPTAGQIGTYVVTFTAVDQYGFPAAPLPIVIVVDAQLPKSWATLSAAPNGQGWNKSDVLVTIFASDDQAVLDITYSVTGAQPISVKDAPNDGVTPISFDPNGVASTSFTISSEGLTTITFHATDIAGGSDKGDTVTVKLDKTSPTATLITPPPPSGGEYIINQPVAVSYKCNDPAPSSTPSPGADPAALVPSGVASCVGGVANGSALDTTSVGVKAFATSVTATDKADNSSGAISLSATYKVSYKICLQYDPTKPTNVGGTVAIKLQICDWNDKNLSSPAITLTATQIVLPNGTAEDAGQANPGGAFRYDGTLKGGGYIYNLKTAPPMTPGPYSLQFTVAGDPIVHTAPFQLK